MAHNNLAVLELDGSAAELEDAIAHVTEALRINPRAAEAHNSLGYALQRKGRLEAAAQYAAAIRLQPGLAEAHNNLGTVRQAEGRRDEAAANYANALRLKPRYGEAHRNLGLLLLSFGRIDEAATHLGRGGRWLRVPDQPGSDAPGPVTVRLPERLPDEAIAEYRAAIALDAKYSEGVQTTSASRWNNSGGWAKRPRRTGRPFDSSQTRSERTTTSAAHSQAWAAGRGGSRVP